MAQKLYQYLMKAFILFNTTVIVTADISSALVVWIHRDNYEQIK